MATRARKPETVELANLPNMAVGTTDELSFRSPTDERRDAEFEDIVNELGSDSRVRVWQIIDGKSSYAGEMSGAEFSLDTLLETYGGGDKSLVIYQGKMKKDTVRVSLDPSIPPRNPRMTRMMAGQVAASPAGDMSNMFATIMATQMQGLSATQQMMTGMVTAMTTLMTARPEKDPTDMALKLAEVLRPKDGGGGAAVADIMAMFERGMNVGKSINGGGDSDSVMPVISEGVKTLGHLIDGIVTEKKANAEAIRRGTLAPSHNPPVPLLAAPVTEVAPPQSHEEPMSVRPWVDAARPHMGMLLKASAFLSPHAAADTVARSLSDDQFFDLVADIEDQAPPGFGQRLLAYFPDAAAVNPVWIGELVAVILSDYVKGDDESEDDEPHGGPSTNGAKGSEAT
jgi:hypothetical protein